MINRIKFSRCLAFMFLFFILACEQDADPLLNESVREEMVNPYLLHKGKATSGRSNPYSEEIAGGIGQNIGPVITPAGGFMVSNDYRFEEGQEFYVDIAIGNNRSIVFFLTGAAIVVGKSNGEMDRPDTTTEAFAYNGVAYVWGLRDDEKFTWTIAFRKGGINHVDILDGHIGKPDILTTTITKYIPETILTNSPSITFEFISNDGTATFECVLDDGTPGPCTSPQNYDGLAEGQHTFQVRAVRGTERDEAGSTHTWEIDLSPPVFSLVSITPTETSIQIDWSTSEPATTAIAWGLSAEAPENEIAESNTYLNEHQILLENLNPGTLYYFYIYGKDVAGNTIRSDIYSSATSLTTTITSYVPENSVTNSPAITFEFISNDPDATFDCTLNGGGTVPCTSPITYSGLADGSYTFNVQAVHGSQRDENGATHSWRVDTTPPFITFISTTTTSSTIQIDWTTSEPTTAYLEWGLNPVPDNMIPESTDYVNSRSIQLTGLRSASVYYFYIGGKDQAGNIYRSSRFSSATRR